MNWYHNGSDTMDAPAIGQWERNDYSRPMGFSDGPFKTYADAKADLMEHYKRMIYAYEDALKAARSLKE